MTMKPLKSLIIAFVAAASMLCASCKDEDVYYLDDSHWILHTEGVSEGKRLNLTFEGDKLTVKDRPFLSNFPLDVDVWDYYISDGYLHASRTYYDDGYQEESYSFRVEFSDNESQMTLTQQRLLSSDRVFVFDRR